MIRDKQKTQEKMVAAVGYILARDGFSKFGVNSVSRQAKVDKALIYRYFGGLPGLLRAYGNSIDFWPSLDEIIGDIEVFKQKSIGEKMAELLVQFARAMRRRPMTLEIMAWELVEHNELTQLLADVREQWVEKFFQRFSDEISATNLDIAATSALFGAAINYLLIRGRNTHIFNKIAIDSDLGWQRLEAALTEMCLRCFISA
jgi:AcrR family transcriptional regulator